MIPILKVAKSGGSVLDDTKDLAFDSTSRYMIILSEYHFQSDSSGSYDITHNLGYIPSFFLYSSADSTNWTRPGETFFTGSYADSNKIYIRGLGESEYAHVVIWSNSYDDSIGDTNNNASGIIKISKSGYDASLSHDLRQFKFVSGKGMMIIKEKKQITVTLSSTYDSEIGMYIITGSSQYSHGLGYVPQIQAFLGGKQIPYVLYLGGGNGLLSYEFSVNNSSISVVVDGAWLEDLSGTTVTFDFYIYFNKII